MSLTATSTAFPPIRTARRIDDVTYAVRDVVALARQAEAAGRKIISLNIGDPCQFDFRTPEVVVEASSRRCGTTKPPTPPPRESPRRGRPSAATPRSARGSAGCA